MAPTRLKVAQLLHVLVRHQETGVTQHLEKLAPALTAALADDEQEVVTWVSGRKRGTVGTWEVRGVTRYRAGHVSKSDCEGSDGTLDLRQGSGRGCQVSLVL